MQEKCVPLSLNEFTIKTPNLKSKFASLSKLSVKSRRYISTVCLTVKGILYVQCGCKVQKLLPLSVNFTEKSGPTTDVIA